AEVLDIGGLRDAPAYTYDKPEIPYPAMEDYDIVVWVTGYAADPLTNTPRIAPGDYGGNLQEMRDYLVDNGYLMIVGTDPFTGLLRYFNEGRTYEPDPLWAATQEFADAYDLLYNYLGISRIVQGYDLPYLDGSRYLLGVDTAEGSITPPPEGGGDYNLLLRDLAMGNGLSSMFVPRDVVMDKDGSPYFDIPTGTMTTQALHDASEPWVNGVRAWSFPDALTETQYRTVSLGWDIEQIKYLNQKIDLFANILEYFDWEIRVGRDLAVTKMEMFILSEDEAGNWERLPINDLNVPKYLDTIEIEVSVRNNGPGDESSTLIFYVTGPNGIEVPVTPNIPDPRPVDQWTDPTKTSDANPVDILDIDRRGGEVTKYKLWLALGAGLYTFRVMVDPYHLISEINEENNDITYSTSTLASIVAENNILIVDDDGSEDNYVEADRGSARGEGLVIDYARGEPSTIIESVVSDLDYDYEVFTIQNYFDNGWIIGNGPGIVDLKRFNSVIWVTAESGSVSSLSRETLTDFDILNIMKYLNGLYDEAEFLEEDHNENIMFIGKRILNDLAPYDHLVTDGSVAITTGQFAREYLGVEPQSPSPAIQQGRTLYGRRTGDFFQDTYFGIEYRSSDLEGGLPFRFLPLTLSSEPDFDTRPALASYGLLSVPLTISVQQQKVMESPPNYFRTLYHAWDLDSLLHTSATPGDTELPMHEILFLSLNWFDTPEDQPELMSRNMLLEFSSDNPSIGNAYILQVKIANKGGVSGGGTVRFIDGSTLFKSEYIFLDPGDQLTIEAIWEPLYAGNREIKVWIDRWDDYDEVFDTINNIPTKMKMVYFFWDDMEMGPEKWEHDSLVTMINGENPLDYYDPLDPEPQTNVISEWDDLESSGVVKTDESYRSSPYSFYLEETEGVYETADVLISFVIDDSASMEARYSSSNKTWLEEAKDAALTLLEQLSDDSVVVSIWDFSGNNERRYAGPTDRRTSENGIQTTIRRDPIRIGDDFSGVSGRDRVRNEIDGMDNPSGTTILWDAIGEAYLDVVYWSTYYPDLNPTVIVLSDGMDLQASDRSGLSVTTADNKIEGGSTYWSPWDDMAAGEQYHQYHLGKYTLDWSTPSTSTYWMYAMAQGSMTHDRTGLLYSDIPIYTVGLGVEHHEPPYEPVLHTWPVSSIGSHVLDYSNAMCDDPVCQESGTLEYNLWRIADTSDAKYFYAPTADELKEVFKTIGTILANPQQQTRSSEPTRQEEFVNNTNKWAVTPAMDLSASHEATLTFWQRYNIVDGANGGYVLIGYMDPLVDTDENGDPTDDIDWNYATPLKGFYSGSMMPGVERDDSFGNDIIWGWNGLSNEGTFGWEFVEFDILEWVPEEYRNSIRVRFQYTQYGGGTGDGWWIDDVRIVTSREDTEDISATETDTWKLVTGSTWAGTTHSGSRSWLCAGPGGGDLQDGIDNSLYTRSIDLTNARYAYLEFYTRFNLQYAAGRPPDGFRVEVSKDGGLKWAPLNYGVRTSWKVSGTESDASDGLDGDGRSYTGIVQPGDSNNWVPASSITRMSINLNGYTGEVIKLRFRVVTNIDGQHYEDPDMFMGVYIDDVVVYGESQEGTRSEEAEGPVDVKEDVTRSVDPVGTDVRTDDGDTIEVPVMYQGPETVNRDRFGVFDGNVFGLLFVSVFSTLMLLFAAIGGIVLLKRRRGP
ncbi:MAG: hypothetical protein ACMUHY_08130, partial [Thermoplasmatota archaeon]